MLSIGLLVVQSATAEETTSSQIARCDNLVVFYSKRCPHCTRALVYLDELKKRAPDFTISTYEVTESDTITERFLELSKQFEVERPGVPAFYA